MIPILTLATALAGTPNPIIMFAAKSHLPGGAVVGQVPWDLGPLQLGPALGLYYYWYELDLYAQKQILGGFLIFTGWAGWEPGWFIPADDRESGRV